MSLGSTESHFAKTVIQQGHLSPLPCTTRPSYWGYDHALSVIPTPNLLVLADVGDGFEERVGACEVVNPGMFGHEFKFLFYRPGSGEVEVAAIPS
jgi:DNA polymerase epsilon subunit 2